MEPSTQHKDQAEWNADSPDKENTEPDVRQLNYEGPNVLERDYARCSLGAHPMNLAAPMALPSIRQPTGSQALPLPMQGQVGQAALQGQARNNHKNQMIESLRHHIRDSLVGIPFDLPEIKGL
jgi:hypothetical protein